MFAVRFSIDLKGKNTAHGTLSLNETRTTGLEHWTHIVSDAVWAIFGDGNVWQASEQIFHLLDACRHRKSTCKYQSAIGVPVWIIQFLRNNLPISRTCNARRWTPRDRGRLIACANDGIVSDCCKLRILFAHKLHQVAVCIAGHTLSVSISSDHIALYAMQLLLDETSKLIYQNI